MMEPTHTTCLEVEPLLPLYVGADLEPSEMEQVAEHLNGCETCRNENLALLETRERLLRLDDAPWTKNVPDLWSGIRSELVSEGLIAGAQSRPALPSIWQRVRVGGLAAAAALVVSFGFLQWLDGGQGTTLPTSSPIANELEARPSAMPTAPLRTSPGMTTVSNGQLPGAQGLPFTPQVNPDLAVRNSGGLRKAGPDEESLLDRARPVDLELRPATTSPRRGSSLVGNRLRQP